MTKLAKMTVGSWADFRDSLAAVNKDLVKVIDQIDPDPSLKLYKISYPYGSEIIKFGDFFVPNDSGQLVQIGDSSLPAQVNQDLSYNARSLPIGVLMKNSIEVYIENQDKSLPLLGYKNYIGKLFGLYRVLNTQSSFRVPNALWNLSAGSRSIFMLPKISNEVAHTKINKLINHSLENKNKNNNNNNNFTNNSNPPRNLSEQWQVFSRLYQSGAVEQFCQKNWDVEIIFFSNDWFQKLKDHSWGFFYNHLYRNLISVTDYFRKNQTWDAMLSLLDLDKNMTHNAYVNQEVRHVLGIATGEMPAFAPARDDLFAPVSAIQKIYTEVYGLNYIPTMIQPTFLDLEHNATQAQSVYYSMNHPVTLFAINKNNDHSVIANLYDTANLVRRYLSKISQQQEQLLIPQFDALLNQVEFNFFHPSPGSYSCIQSSKEIAHVDHSWQKCENNIYSKGVAAHGAFFQGCVQIDVKNKVVNKLSNISNISNNNLAVKKPNNKICQNIYQQSLAVEES